MTGFHAVLGALGIATILAGGCADPSVAPSTRAQCARGNVCVTGEARFFTLEGGFWAVRGDDNVVYEIRGGLPAEFRMDGLRVFLVARVLPVGSYIMVGPVVAIVAIERLR